MFHVSLVGRKDLSGEIYRQIRKAILDGRLRPEDRLPPSRELARTLAVSRATVTVAYERLAGEGFVVSLQGAGTFVSEWAARQGREAAHQRSDGAIQPRPVWQSIPLPTAFERPAQFDFRTGLPDATLFPHRTWRRLVARVLRSNELASKITYEHPAGHGDLRAAIARHIGNSRGVEASMDDIIVTNGTQQALDILARVLLEPGDRIAVEDPCYEPPRRSFESLGIRVVGVPVDRDGLVVDALPRGVRVVYVTPSHQYPLAVTMTLARRQALLAWADRNGAAVIEDDYDGEFRFEGRPLEPLQTLDTTGRVIYVGSFSKTMLPTLRLGFLVTPPSLRMAVQKAKYVSDWHTSTLEQAALARFIDDGGFARHVRRVGGIYRERREMIADAIRRDFADHLELIPSTLGLHLTAIARNATVEQITGVWERAADAGVTVHRLAAFAVGETARPGIVLGYGAIPASDIGEGLRRLRACFNH
ncbi:PLP-dependent aminotransferase family protein [Chelativorans salis]|uniref:PLP-dependent aminotransferase family protein n=1 Tax=Chelativorans salis TaxID=2978478 RepID=A0ABT2LJX8_9HYPH|nr:PLP-dependent aminotransferase family protein [Chelativorans sp. EGI FJ00035]MCT7374551.1 PLP-dependent aminotransferase family protein [Chelativorans sp. EGI FJ00035]